MTFSKDALSGQHIVISGGVGALGLGIVKKLTEHGAVVSVNDVIRESSAREKLTEAGIDMSQIHYIQADMTQKSDVDNFIDGAIAKFGAIHTALCHAGIVTTVKLIDVDVDEWDRVMAINLRAAMLLAQASVRHMLNEGIKGQIIFTTSWVARNSLARNWSLSYQQSGNESVDARICP